LEIALGSAFELETQLLIIQNVKLLSEDEVSKSLELVCEEQKMIQ
jgi:four helix bundle protein